MRIAALSLLGLARCATPPPAEPSVTATPVGRAPATLRIAATPAPQILDARGRPVLLNDPPAPASSPLCGPQQREMIAIDSAQAEMRDSGACALFTCYDPLTATYLGADGDRHVCR